MEHTQFYKNKNGYTIALERKDTYVLYTSFSNFIRYDFENEVDAISFFKSKEKEIIGEGAKKVTITSVTLPTQFNSFEEAKECFNQILEKEALFTVFDFLKLIDKNIKAQFVKELKILRKFYDEYIDTDKNLWKRRGSDIQIDSIALAALALMNKTDVKPWTEVYSLLREVQFSYIEKVLDYFKPNWLNDFILERTLKSQWGKIQYQQLLYLEGKGYLHFNPELVVATISDISFWDFEAVTDVKYLFENKMVYQRDIPLLFEYPTNFHNYTTLHVEGQKQQKAWEVVILTLVSHGKLDRLFVIEKCIEIQTKNWNNGQLSFFRSLLENLKPTPSELMQFHNQLFLLLPISNKTVYNFGVKLIKRIAFEDAFNKEEFIDWTSSIMSNYDAKTSIISILQIFEKYAKQHPNLQSILLQKTAEVFIINDYEVQQRASNLLVKYAQNADSALIEVLSAYRDQMLGSISIDLAFLMGDKAVIEPLSDEVDEEQSINLDFKKIPDFDNWDDIFYAIGNAVNSDNPIDFELVLNAFLTKKNLFPTDFPTKLKIYQKPINDNYKGKAARYDLTVLLNLIMNNGASKVNFSDDDTSNKLLSIRKHLIEYIFATYNARDNVSLLSMPTHYPYFIEANVLLERIVNYETKKLKINQYDLMIAINRMIQKFDSKSTDLVNKLSDKYRQLFQILLEENDDVAFEKASALMSQNSLHGNRNVFQKALKFVAQQNKKLEKVIDDKTLNHFEISDKSYLDCVIMTSRLRLPFHKFEVLDTTIYKNIPFASASCEAKLTNETVVYTYVDYDKKTRYDEKIELVSNFSSATDKTYFYYSYNIKNPKTKFTDYWEYAYNYAEALSVYDVKTYFGLMPIFTEPIFASLYTNEYRRASFFSEITSAEVLKFMLQPFFKIGYFSNWFLVCSQLADKKEVRLLSTEVLLHLIEKKQLNSEAFTQKIIELHQSKYATIQRYIENLSMLKNVSSLHNNFLLYTIEQLLLAFSLEEKVPTNTKKLVEILYDLKVKSNGTLSNELKVSLEKWKQNTTLKKLIDNLLKL